MALAPLAYTLFKRYLRVNPRDPEWPDRDRFVLSAGHACVLQYSLLHLCGWDLSLDDLKQFRQWGSRTPGPPRARPHARRRGDDRPARPGRRQRRRHGDRRALPRRALQPPGPRARRPPHLRDLLRRRPDGGHQPGGRVDRRALRPRQAELLLRRQPHHDRRHDRRSRSTPRATPRASRRRAGTCSASRTPRTSTRSSTRPTTARAETERPSFIFVRSHIAYPAPTRSTPPRRTARRSARTRCARRRR